MKDPPYSLVSDSNAIFTGRFVLWPRMDQKSCFKAILTAGLTAVVVPMRVNGDEVCTDMEALEAKLNELGADAVLCVLTTTSCFSPRAPDRVDEVAALCARHPGVGHIINNACKVIQTKTTTVWPVPSM